MKRREPARDPNGLPVAVAAGPDHPAWEAPSEHQRRNLWLAAGRTWSLANGHGPNGWRQLLPEPVRYAESALGRARARHQRAGKPRTLG